jgi:hypothetical protein
LTAGAAGRAGRRCSAWCPRGGSGRACGARSTSAWCRWSTRLKYRAGFGEAKFAFAVPADARRVPLPARLRAAVGVDGQARVGSSSSSPSCPRSEAPRVLRTVAETGAGAKVMRPYLGVLKRHRPDPFLHDARARRLLDGDGLRRADQSAMGRERLWKPDARDGGRSCSSAGGRFYWAKDGTLAVASSFERVPRQRPRCAALQVR